MISDKVHGFVLRNLKWACLDIKRVFDFKDKKHDANDVGHKTTSALPSSSLDRLVLSERDKKLVKSLVTSHLEHTKYNKLNKHPSTDHEDIVRGKGKGLIILLHGAPGVGKTSTAECIAEQYGRPLFPITCGDIGHEPAKVQQKLEEHFDLAHRWDCVLLLDEADVFLARRDLHDLQRNSLVAVCKLLLLMLVRSAEVLLTHQQFCAFLNIIAAYCFSRPTASVTLMRHSRAVCTYPFIIQFSTRRPPRRSGKSTS